MRLSPRILTGTGVGCRELGAVLGFEDRHNEGNDLRVGAGKQQRSILGVGVLN